MGMSAAGFGAPPKSTDEVHQKPAGLIPFNKPGDGATVTPIFPAALRLVIALWIGLAGMIWSAEGFSLPYCHTYDEIHIHDSLTGLVVKSSCGCSEEVFPQKGVSAVFYDVVWDTEELENSYYSSHCNGALDVECGRVFPWIPVAQWLYIKNEEPAVTNDYYKCWYDPWVGFSAAQKHNPPEIVLRTEADWIADGGTFDAGNLPDIPGYRIQYFTVVNKGTESLHVSNITSTAASNISVYGVNPTTFNVDADSTAQFSVRYDSVAVGSFSFELDIFSSDGRAGKSPYDMTVTGTAGDITPPDSWFHGAPDFINNTTPFDVSANFSEPVTGFVAGDIAVGNGTVSGFAGSGSFYSIEITPDGSGDVTLDIGTGVAQDTAGNGNTAAEQVTVILLGDGTCYEGWLTIPDGLAFSGAGSTTYWAEEGIETEATASSGIVVEAPHKLILRAPQVVLNELFNVEGDFDLVNPPGGGELEVIIDPVVCP